MINEKDVKLIINVFNKCDNLTVEEKLYLDKLNLIQKKVDLHDEFLERFKTIDEQLSKTN